MVTPSSIRSILAALDDSSRAPLVFRTAASLARTMGAELFLVRVLSVPPEIPPAAHSQPDFLEATLTAAAKKELHAIMTEAPEVTFGSPVVVLGDPWRHILEVGRELDVDLIVMGSHRYHGLDRVLGTNAAKVVNHADRDVFIVHDRREKPKGG
jgi:nucleotide-binding universal stress UspA family protein